MKIEAALAESIARNAIDRPYRQIHPMPTDDFVKWLKERGILVGRWEALHHLWMLGVVRPILVGGQAIAKTPGLSNDGRFVSLDLTEGEDREEVFVDLGQDVDDESNFSPPDYPAALRKTLLWHPFQLWFFDSFDDALIRRYSWTRMLAADQIDPGVAVKRWRDQNIAALRQLEDDSHDSFPRLLALLLAVEPLVHTEVYSKISLDWDYRNGFHGFVAWRESQIGFHELTAVGLTIDQAIDWHQELSFTAQMRDPAKRFRKLLRHADRTKRDKLKGNALLAHTLYDTAEVLRRYVERYHWRILPDESDVHAVPSPVRLNLQHFGNSRPSDFRRPVFRRIARYFGVDPGYRTVCFLEGQTEVGFVRRWAENHGIDLDRASVRLENLHGKNNVSPDTFEEQLRRFRDEEVFVIVCVDRDHPQQSPQQAKHIRKLDGLRASGLMPVDFEIFAPNFIEANFTTAEVVAMVNATERDQGFDLGLSVDAVEKDRKYDENDQPRSEWKTLEKTLGDLTKPVTGRRLPEKSEPWGRTLADWAARQPVPVEKMTEDGLRPIDVIGRMLLRGRIADYRLTVQQLKARSVGDNDDGDEGE